MLGAGASVPAGVPTALKMTDKMLDFCKTENQQEYTKALCAIIGALQMGVGQSSIASGVDVERVLNAASLLGDRFALEFAPFVGAWHPIIDELEHQKFSRERKNNIINGLSHDLSSINFSFSRFSPPTSYDFETVGNSALRELKKDILNTVNDNLSKRPDGSLFQELKAYLTGKLIELTWIKTQDKLAYLDPLIKLGRNNAITIATLNYDNSIELRAANNGIECETGIKDWNNTGCFTRLGNGVDLIKLHGSVKWYWASPPKNNSFGLEPHAFIEVEDNEIEGIKKHLFNNTEGIGKQLGVIFGGNNKLTAKGPFLELLVKFKKALANSSELIIIGYSFRDQHINHCISNWVHHSQNKIVIIDTNESLLNDNTDLYSLSRQLNERMKFEAIGAAAGIEKYCKAILENT